MKFFKHMYGNEPDQWSDKLKGQDQLRFIINCFTRMRLCDAKGRLDFHYIIVQGTGNNSGLRHSTRY
jgi:bis(5'-nucleosyl)-tetraphosphatase (symmetrical)